MTTREDDGPSVAHDDQLTAEIVFERLEQLRELLRLTDYLREFRPARAHADRGRTGRDVSDDADR
jgi:hypothetical protein